MTDGNPSAWVDEPQHADHDSDSSFERDVQIFVLEKLRACQSVTLTCPSLTTQFLDEHVDIYGPLGRWNAAAYIGVAQTIRPILRKAFGDEPDDVQLSLDLPEEKLLQDRYSVPGAGGDGEPAYVPRHMLTKEQMESVVLRHRALSRHHARHADALESWWYRNNSEATQ